MSERLPSRKQAFLFLHQNGCSKEVINHCEAVSRLASKIARALQKRGVKVDLKLIEIGALLHDIGRSKTHSVHHAIIGAEIAQSLGLPEQVISIIKSHVGGGITVEEADKLGWPADVYTPQTLEEKVVAYSDKLVEGFMRVPIERTFERLSEELPPSVITRMWKLHEEMTDLIGEG